MNRKPNGIDRVHRTIRRKMVARIAREFQRRDEAGARGKIREAIKVVRNIDAGR